MLEYIKRALKSIALVPSVLALCFMLIAIFLVTVTIDYDAISFLKGITFDNKEDVQFVLSFLIGGIFTLTIFSYTMVMNVLNRNINNYSPRLIPMLLSDKHHQIILGFTSGTIIYSMCLSVAINSSNNSYFPSIGAPLGILFGIICIILFIYFIHSVSKSIHINYIIKKAYNESLVNIDKIKDANNYLKMTTKDKSYEQVLKSTEVGYLKMPSIKKVNKFMVSNKISIKLCKLPGQFVFENDKILTFSKALSESKRSELLRLFPIDHTVPMDAVETGFKHLVEIGIKAMSPAINDPGTAISTIDYLTQLFIHRSQIEKFNAYSESDDLVFWFSIASIEDLRDKCYVELYRYFKDDPILRLHLANSLDKINSIVDAESLTIAKLKAIS